MFQIHKRGGGYQKEGKISFSNGEGLTVSIGGGDLNRQQLPITCEDGDDILSVDKGKGKAGERTKIDVMAAFMGTSNPTVNVIDKLDGKVDFDILSFPMLTVLDMVVDVDQKLNNCNSVLNDVDLLNLIRLVLKGDQNALLHFIVISCRTMATRFLPFRKAAHKKVKKAVTHTPPEEQGPPSL
ncbi:hypothetical protein AMTRI_Chr03g145500 [Amborella trichopoda]